MSALEGNTEVPAATPDEDLGVLMKFPQGSQASSLLETC